MLLTTHTLAGVAIVSNIDNPAFSLPLAFLSHFAIDLIPHRDYFSFSQFPNFSPDKKRRIFLAISLDFLSGLFLGLFFASQFFPDIKAASALVVGSFLANLPDGVELPYLLGKTYPGLKNIMSFQGRLQTRTRFIPGLLSQLLVAIICLFASL